MFSVVYEGKIAVASIFDDTPGDWFVVDCRPLIDGPGNAAELVQNLLGIGLQHLSSRTKVCFACDYGHSRSNFIAALAISEIAGICLIDAIEYIKEKHPESSIKPSILINYLSLPADKGSCCFGVSGASGIIGSNLLASLRDAGESCVGLSRTKHGTYLENSTRLKLLIKENQLTDIIHLAYPKPFNSYSSSKASFNHLLNLLDACTSTGSTLHYVSGWVVFDGYSGEVADEEALPTPHSLYAQTKLLQEKLIVLHGINNGLDYRIYRLPGVFSRSSLEPRFLRYIADCAATNEDIFIHDFLNGPAVVPLAPLDEAVDLLADQILVKANARADLIHLTHDRYNISIKEIADTIALKYGVKVKLSPVSRVVFNGRFLGRLLPPGSPSSTSFGAEPRVIEFIEELINAKQQHA